MSDHSELYFSKSGNHWVSLLPAAKSDQIGLRDVLLIDGVIQAKDNPKPGQFSFDPEEKFWAYRSTDGADENLVTTYSVKKLYTRKQKNQLMPSPDPVVYHFSPDLTQKPFVFDSRDYDFNFPHEALLFHTSYIPARMDSSHVYIIFNGKREQD